MLSLMKWYSFGRSGTIYTSGAWSSRSTRLDLFSAKWQDFGVIGTNLSYLVYQYKNLQVILFSIRQLLCFISASLRDVCLFVDYKLTCDDAARCNTIEQEFTIENDSSCNCRQVIGCILVAMLILARTSYSVNISYGDVDG